MVFVFIGATTSICSKIVHASGQEDIVEGPEEVATEAISEMLTNLVTLDANKQPVTDSLTVAVKFGKRHKHVLDSIKALNIW